MQKKVVALCLRVQFFLANPIYTEIKSQGNRGIKSTIISCKILASNSGNILKR